MKFEALRAFKDKGLSAAFRKGLGDRLAAYGEVREVRLDSAAKTLELDLLLDGETRLVILTVTDYLVVEEDGTCYLEFGAVTASRPWMTRLVADVVARWLPDKRVRIDPPALARIMKTLL